MKKSKLSSKKETILIVVLAVILAGMVYYRFVEMNVTANMEKAQASIDANQVEYDLAAAELAQLKSMSKKLNDYESTGTGYLASYNNVKKEIQLLDKILKPTIDYSMNLSDPVQTGDLVRRNIAIRFTIGNYPQAFSVIKEFGKSEYRNIIQDITYSTSATRKGDTRASANMNVTFYETMVGGEADAGLIVAKVETPEEEEGEQTE